MSNEQEQRPRSQADHFIAKMKRAFFCIRADDQRREFIRSIIAASRSLYDRCQKETIHRPRRAIMVDGVRQRAFVLTIHNERYVVTHARTWIRLKAFGTEQEAVEWLQRYWLRCSPSTRSTWSQLSRPRLLWLACQQIDPSLLSDLIFEEERAA